MSKANELNQLKVTLRSVYRRVHGIWMREVALLTDWFHEFGFEIISLPSHMVNEGHAVTEDAVKSSESVARK